jgi:MoaA/NifB/PqqE/SkfB family radical SAM enzyme
MSGRTVDDYDAPLFLAWQLTNRCSARCLACCEESGPDKAWRDELSRDEALRLAGAIVDIGIPFVAFGGGEPLGVAHCWDVFERLATGSRRSPSIASRFRSTVPARARTSACGPDRASRRRSERSSASWRAG